MEKSDVLDPEDRGRNEKDPEETERGEKDNEDTERIGKDQEDTERSEKDQKEKGAAFSQGEYDYCVWCKILLG